jgi:hypothetical protein
MTKGRLYLDAAQNIELENETSYVREMEMTLDMGETPRQNGVVMQFFQDFSVYGVDEAIVYAEGYEKQGMFKKGTIAKVKDIRKKLPSV